MDDVATIYVVDDDIEFLTSLARSLKLRGFRVEPFSSAEDFIAHYQVECYGCLILDYGLPGMSGLELQEQLKARGMTIPIIFITGHGGVPESVQATKAGAIDFLEKPYKPDVLVAQIETALEMCRVSLLQNTLNRKLEMATGSLTDREREIFNLMLDKPELVSSKAIALELDISPRTVEKHRAQVLLKTGCRSVAELIGRFARLNTRDLP